MGTDARPATLADGGAKGSADSGASNGRSSNGPLSALAPFLTAVGTGVGLLGFVAFFGGAILWTQADSAGLPASETVALVPKSVLLSTGAHFLTSAILLALLGVGVLWAYDTVLRDRLLREVEAEERSTAERRANLQSQLEEAEAQLAAADETSRIAASARAGALQAVAASPQSTVFIAALAEAEESYVQAGRQMHNAEAHLAETREHFEQAMPSMASDAEQARRTREHRDTWIRLTLLGIPLLGLELALTTFASLAWYDYLALVALSATTTSIILVVYAETEKFTWFAVAAFLAIGLYLGFATYFRTRDTPKAEPAAALIDGRSLGQALQPAA